MAAGDLTTLENVKAYAPGLTPAQAGADDTFDELLARLISATSERFAREVNRDLAAADYVEVRNGHGGAAMTLNHWPVISVTTVKVDGTTIATRPSVGQDGWVLDGSRLVLVGARFTEGTANVEITYRAGYEANAVPADIEQAVIKMTLLQFHDRKRIGLASTSQAGESVSFNSDGTVLAFWASVVASHREQAI